ncbi:hypothetical protein P5774_27430, partial [Bacillus tropicus]|uniref:hypothetical protein n=1 Tax=Bacillus tropicus TaxID=2026188 RepID=UPI0024077511
AGSISEDHNSHKNYFIVNPIIGKKALAAFPYLAVAISNIGILYKRRNNVIVSVDKWLFR